MKLYYVHDPMCSWCWAFRPVLAKLLEQLPEAIILQKVLGGLAADTDQAMLADMQKKISDGWHRIQKTVPSTQFNFDFWTDCLPRRSTYASCRAVLAAAEFDQYETMVLAIQHAYYLQAKNPSDNDVLIELAVALGIDKVQFEQTFLSQKIADMFLQQLQLTQSLGVHSFPELVLEINGSRWPVPVDYNNADIMLETIDALVEFSS